MSQELSLISLEHLLRWVLREEETGEIFGIPRELFFKPSLDDPFRFERYGKTLETPIGVAAGPHTQMAQNIIAAWLCGARYIELKTVQTLDELKVSKPCIDLGDEGYNCEWSQELRLKDSFNEYLHAWIILHILRHKWGWADDGGPGFIFNLSVGYNMEGILKPNVQEFLRKARSCKELLAEKIDSIKHLYPDVVKLAIPDRISDNITLSTMHGCPPDEIEKIGRYLIEEQKLHTTIKLNPTLLGPRELRRILNEELGWGTEVPDIAFEHDLKYPDALKLIKNLRDCAKKAGVHFGLKLTNTLESINNKKVFPPNEKMMYMSGRALHPISVKVGRKLQNEFGGELDLSFSAGADCYNLPDLLACNIKPVTVCSDILKPGGYMRLTQYLEETRKRCESLKVKDIEALVKKTAGGKKKPVEAALANLNKYADHVTENPAYRKDSRLGEHIKTGRKLTAFDCVQAPCIGTCPANQDIPKYLHQVALGNDAAAMEVILRTNPLPNVAGLVCDHQCQTKCTRLNYDQPLLIREIKRFVAERQKQQPLPQPAAPNGLKVAIIGAGPSGLACAYFLVQDGFEVEIFETKSFAGGMISDAIPTFRLTAEAIAKDVDYIASLGVKFHYQHHIDKQRFSELQRSYDFVYLAIGAQKAKRLGIPNDQAKGVVDFLWFLSQVRRGRKVDLGKNVIVLGGGNSAMDVARTAHRCVGKGGEVQIVYRRTRNEMPADREEIEALLHEGIKIRELTAPVSVVLEQGKAVALRCSRMQLGEPDADGRRKPVRIEGADFDIPADSIIPAIGQDVALDFVDGDLGTDPVTGQTKLAKVFAGGDLVRGAATVIKAIGDGKSVALNIIKAANRRIPLFAKRETKGLSRLEYRLRRAKRIPGAEIPTIEGKDRKTFKLVNLRLDENTARAEASRCLYCDDFCGICATVCPNRANVNYTAQPGDYPVFRGVRDGDVLVLKQEGTFRVDQEPQVLNIGDFCNECGNCTTFCPTSGAPYLDKPKFYLTDDSFGHEQNGYRLLDGELRARVNGRVETLAKRPDRFVYETDDVYAELDMYSLAVREARFKHSEVSSVTFEHAVRMAVLLKALQNASFR